MSKQEMRYSAALSREQAAATLEELAAALRGGTIRVSADDREIVITPRDVVDLEVDVSRKSDKGKLRLELSWRELQSPDGPLGLRFEAARASSEDDAESGEEASSDDEADASDTSDTGDESGEEASSDDEADTSDTNDTSDTGDTVDESDESEDAASEDAPAEGAGAAESDDEASS